MSLCTQGGPANYFMFDGTGTSIGWRVHQVSVVVQVLCMVASAVIQIFSGWWSELQRIFTLAIVGCLQWVNLFGDERSGYRRKSTITDTEDVSYVSSAYVPQCLRYGGRPTLSNAHRAHESGVNTNNIRDELDEVITLNSVSIIVAEYIPFGANQVTSLLDCSVDRFLWLHGGGRTYV